MSPPNSMEPDTVSADTMGDVLVDETLPDGTRIVCCREPGSELTKYWAVRREDTLIRFCVEESTYSGDYGVEPFSNVLGQSGFRILAPRGGYYAYDYYVPDSVGVPRLLAGCANEVEEADFNGDGETDLRWFYHGGQEMTTYFRRDGKLYESGAYTPAFETDLYLAANGGSVEGSASMSGGIDRGNLLKKLTYTPRENGYTGSGRTLQLRVGNQETSYSEFYEGTNLVAILAVLKRAIMKPPVLRMSC